MLPRARGWIVQTIWISATFAGEEREYAWTEAWRVRKKGGRATERIELGGEDAFLVPRAWIAAGAGRMEIRASAWFQCALDADVARVPGKCDGAA